MYASHSQTLSSIANVKSEKTANLRMQDSTLKKIHQSSVTLHPYILTPNCTCKVFSCNRNKDFLQTRQNNGIKFQTGIAERKCPLEMTKSNVSMKAY